MYILFPHLEESKEGISLHSPLPNTATMTLTENGEASASHWWAERLIDSFDEAYSPLSMTRLLCHG